MKIFILIKVKNAQHLYSKLKPPKNYLNLRKFLKIHANVMAQSLILMHTVYL